MKLPVLVVLVIIGLLLEVTVHLYNHTDIVYTHFFYLIVIVAGFWYGKKAIGIALLFGGLHVAVSWQEYGSLPGDAIIRATILVFVAAVMGIVVDRMNAYHARLIAQNQDLKKINSQLESSQKAAIIANKKLALLSSITRHDIKNQLTALMMYLGISRATATDPEQSASIDHEEQATQNILRQIEFTRIYEDIGSTEPRWQNIVEILDPLKKTAEDNGVIIEIKTGSLEIYADGLLAKVFENLIDNSLRHGITVRHIEISCKPEGENMILEYRDDGSGIKPEEKELIFKRGYGKNTGLGLFLIREILSITGISITETGTWGQGVNFEILVPKDRFRQAGE